MSDTPTPPTLLYKQVHDAVFERIISGELGPGAMLPSEMELAAAYKVSQGTARKALSELEQSGVVERIQGRGTFVATTTPEKEHFHFFRLRSSDRAPAIPNKGLSSIIRREATADEKKHLKMDTDDVFEINRTRAIDNEPVCHEVCLVEAAKFSGLMDRDPLPNSLYPLYQRAYGQRIIQADENLKAVPATSPVAKLLGIKKNTPILEVERFAIGISGAPVEYRITYFIADKYHYNIVLK
ncbi:GntR family transcriptional regulator [Lentilitoribacter sp. Alg239-R112]|jgi:GntR family transcriptional regulator|uniref:GntR family transcriptional regulator n=1 Tax=Lentilitoribacter sp. Alg239-R112 TaxID=2305987 RepID=UPI0013A6943A|nr:GntR family transcriptional regulator [Lentilitoribacter sp. Alg239-R112]